MHATTNSTATATAFYAAALAVWDAVWDAPTKGAAKKALTDGFGWSPSEAARALGGFISPFVGLALASYPPDSFYGDIGWQAGTRYLPTDPPGPYMARRVCP